MSPPKRQSCDRCHAQKLQCSRQSPDATASCTRCVRQGLGASCVYSSPLPKGRPRKSHPAPSPLDTNHANETCVFSLSSSAYLTPDSPAELNPTSTYSDQPITALAPPNSALSEQNPLAFVSDNSNIHADQPGGWPFAAYGNGLSMVFTQDDGSMDTSWMASVETLHDISDPGPIDETEGCAKLLLDLLSRLYPTYRASLSFQDLSSERTDGMMTTAAFEAAYAALFESSQSSKTNPASGFCTVYETFTASRKLLDIVSRLVHAVTFTDHALRTSDVSAISQVSLVSNLPYGNSSQSGPPPTADGLGPGGSNKSADYHLVIACYSLLLHTYSALIATLHTDASSHACANSSRSPPSSIELRLVLVIQLITYLMAGLQQIMHAYSSKLDSSIAELEGKARRGLNELQRALKNDRTASQ